MSINTIKGDKMKESGSICDKLDDIIARMNVMFVVLLIVLVIQTVLLFTVCWLLSEMVK